MSKSRIIRFLVDQSRRMESAVDRLRHVWDNFQPVEPLQPGETVATPPSGSGARGPGSGGRRVRPDEESPSRRRQVVPLTSSGSSQETLPTPPSIRRHPDSPVQTLFPSSVEARTDPTDPAEEGHSTPFQFRTPPNLEPSPIPIPVWRTRAEDNTVTSRVLRSAGSLHDGRSSLLTRSIHTPDRGAASAPNPGEFSPLPHDTPESTFRAFVDGDGRRWRMEP